MVKIQNMQPEITYSYWPLQWHWSW